MEKVRISTIYEVIERLQAKKILVVFENLRSEVERVEGKDQTVKMHLGTEDLFLNHLTAMGVAHEEAYSTNFDDFSKANRRNNTFDLAIAVGESAYQSIGWAARLRDKGFKKPIYVEIRKDDTRSPRDLSILATKAKEKGAIDLLYNLVYTTKSNPSPRYIELAIPPKIHVEKAEKTPPSSARRPKNVRIASISSDIADPPKKIRFSVIRIVRDTAKAQKLKARYDCICQVCGTRIGAEEGFIYAECHHIRPLGGNHNGTDTTDNMLILCPNHHAMFDYGLLRFVSSDEVEIGKNVIKLTTLHQISSASTEYHNTFIAIRNNDMPKR